MSELKPPRFPTMLRKMWSGAEVQAWIDDEWNRRAQPATLTSEQRARLISSGPNAGRVRKDAQPAAQALPAITEQQSKWGRLYTAANELVVKMGYHGSMQADSTEMESLKDKLHDLDGGEWMPGLMPPAQPAAPADAAPSVAPEPVAWQMIDKHGNAVYVPVTYEIKPDLVLDCDLRYPDNAPHEQRPLFAHPPRAPLTPDILLTHRSCYSESEWPVFVGGVRFAEMVHGIGAAK